MNVNKLFNLSVNEILFFIVWNLKIHYNWKNFVDFIDIDEIFT